MCLGCLGVLGCYCRGVLLGACSTVDHPSCLPLNGWRLQWQGSPACWCAHALCTCVHLLCAVTTWAYVYIYAYIHTYIYWHIYTCVHLLCAVTTWAYIYTCVRALLRDRHLKDLPVCGRSQSPPKAPAFKAAQGLCTVPGAKQERVPQVRSFPFPRRPSSFLLQAADTAEEEDASSVEGSRRATGMGHFIRNPTCSDGRWSVRHFPV